MENIKVSADEDENLKKVCVTCKKEYPYETETCPDDGGIVVLPQRDALIGKVFADKYEIIDILGEGGMSVVYKARHRYMDRVVAVKLLLEHLVNDTTARTRFEHESKAASSLSHQNIVTVHDFGMTKKGQAYFVMDCLEGETLAEILEKRTRLPLAEAVAIFKQTCDGLEHAHKKGVVHRDLKPSNLVLIKQDDGSTLVKIVDFGIAKLLPVDGKPRQNITVTGEIFGSPLYMSPEQCNGKSMDQRSDIYSLGCLMYETLAGVPPHMGDSFVNTVVKHINDPPPPFSVTAPDANIPPQVEACIGKCLNKNPDERYQTSGEVRQSLLDAALEAGVKGLRPGAVPVPTKKNSFMAQTFDRVKLSGEHPGSGGTSGSGQHKKATNNNALVIGLGALVLLLSGFITLALWPGPEGDRGPNYVRILWQLDQSQAQSALKSQNYEEARAKLLDAKKLALQFDDRHKRLMESLYLLADVYGKSGMFAEQEKTNQEIIELNTSLVEEEVSAAESMLQKLAKVSDSTVTTTMNQLEAEANADTVILCAKKLLARSLFSQAEKLLSHAIVTYDGLKLENHQKTAEFKSLLAECLLLQQRLTEVRPLLVDALKIRKQAPDPESHEAILKTIKAYLKLGQFDRDQSDFKNSQEELKTGLELAEKKAPDDKELLAEALNSYGDLLRQQGDTAGAKTYLERAEEVGKNLPRHARELNKEPLKK